MTMQTEQAVPKQEAEETATEIMESISAALNEHLGDIAYQLTRIADQLELAVDDGQFNNGKGFVRVLNLE